MFKTILVTVVAVLSLSSCMSTIPQPGQEKSLEKIQEFLDMDQALLFDRANSCVARVYNSANTVVQLRDKVNGQIVIQATGNPKMDMGIIRSFSYTLLLDFKDGKVRIRYENIVSQNVGGTAGPNMAYQWEDVASYLNELTKHLVTQIGNNEKDDW